LATKLLETIFIPTLLYIDLTLENLFDTLKRKSELARVSLYQETFKRAGMVLLRQFAKRPLPDPSSDG
jgi:hypothetical protein